MQERCLMKNSPQAPLKIMKLHTEVQWSDAARKVDLCSLKYVTKEALMRQAARATFFNAPSLHELPAPDNQSTFVIDVSVVDDEEIQDLNNQYRGKNKPTDVLSFAQLEGESTFGAGEQILLGDIIISLPTAFKQATAEGHPLPEEMAFLTVHATLHLLGYDHEKAADKKPMWEQQNAIMARICSWPPNRKR
jgi:probable rRNA maturation factor